MNKLLELERQNLINWYPFKDKSRILVLSEDRALYYYFADKDFKAEYVKCTCDACEGLEQKSEYDYIIIDGVLSYAPSYCRSENSYVEFINVVSKHLIDNGTLFIAAPNRLGLKYLCGAPEQYTGAIGVGLNDYEAAENVRTFTKHELEDLVKKAGYNNVKFFYPYPDYVYPKEIFTDETIGMESYGKDYYEMIRDRLLLYNESILANQLAKEQVADVFANAFLLTVSKAELEDEKAPSYIKINSDRNDEFRISTSFIQENNKKYVVKAPISKAAANHIRHLHDIETVSGNDKYNYLKGEYDGNSLKYEFLKNETLDNIIERCIENQDKENIVGYLDNVYEILLNSKSKVVEYDTEQFISVFGKAKLEDKSAKCVNPANIDLICDNIFICDSVYTIIDGEWTFDFNVPISFIMWRNLNELYYKHSLLKDIISRRELNQRFDINSNDESVFEEWNRFFTLEYVGANQLEQLSLDKYQISLDNVLLEQHRKNMICSSLYVDYGNGYTEENKIYSEDKLCGRGFEIEFKIDNFENVKQLRWDPVENALCNCFAEIKAGDNWVRLKPDNADSINNDWDNFKTMDPRYYINDIVLKESFVVIRGNISYLEKENCISLYSDLEQEYQKSSSLLKEETDSKRLIRKYASILDADYDAVCEERDLLKKELQRTQERVRAVEAERDSKASFELLYNNAVSSKGWRMLERLRKIKRIIKR